MVIYLGAGIVMVRYLGAGIAMVRYFVAGDSHGMMFSCRGLLW